MLLQVEEDGRKLVFLAREMKSAFYFIFFSMGYSTISTYSSILPDHSLKKNSSITGIPRYYSRRRNQMSLDSV